MSDPLRTNIPGSLESASLEAESAAQIERLLLAGLEHYFAAQYDQAINIWSRALFLDRGHARARAYIERARSAQAELQRESEELLQQGVTAFKRGEGEEARRLLQDAVDQGAPPEEALAILERLNRLARAAPSAPASRWRSQATPAGSAADTPRAAWAAIGMLVLVIVAAGAFAGGAFRAEWQPLIERPAVPSASGPRPAAGAALPLPRRGETALLRAQALAQGGRLRDALGALDGVRATDAQKPEADRLRAEIQKRLIALTALPAAAAAAQIKTAPAP
jgi:hypothetical protein